jgi:hypothetical protein
MSASYKPGERIAVRERRGFPVEHGTVTSWDDELGRVTVKLDDGTHNTFGHRQIIGSLTSKPALPTIIAPSMIRAQSIRTTTIFRAQLDHRAAYIRDKAIRRGESTDEPILLPVEVRSRDGALVGHMTYTR